MIIKNINSNDWVETLFLLTEREIYGYLPVNQAFINKEGELRFSIPEEPAKWEQLSLDAIVKITERCLPNLNERQLHKVQHSLKKISERLFDLKTLQPPKYNEKISLQDLSRKVTIQLHGRDEKFASIYASLVSASQLIPPERPEAWLFSIEVRRYYYIGQQNYGSEPVLPGITALMQSQLDLCKSVALEPNELIKNEAIENFGKALEYLEKRSNIWKNRY